MRLGLIGKSLQHSFSARYFAEKFAQEGLSDFSYQNYELPTISALPALLQKEKLDGFNVTIPYKEQVLPFLSSLSADAKAIGAVNTVKADAQGLHGYNTDWQGFSDSLQPLLQAHHQPALILGSGGAARAVYYALSQLGIEATTVSRHPGPGVLSYAEASQQLADYPLVINTTPLGTFPKSWEKPPLELAIVSKNHLFYDLVYNPPETMLLQQARKRGAVTKNGYEMLVLQAEKSWQIWQAHNP